MAKLLLIIILNMTFRCMGILFLFYTTQTQGECFNQANCTGGAEEMKILHKKLLKGYVPEVRPSLYYNTPTKVTIELYITVVMDLDTRQQLVSLRAFFRFIWKDEILQWNATDYGGIDTILVLQNNIWKPDISIYNSADGHDMLGGERVYISVSSEGIAKWEPAFFLRGTCKLDMSKYPFDVSICPIVITSWMSDNESITLQWIDDPVKLRDLMINGEYEISSAGASKNALKFGDSFYEQVSFSISLARRPLYTIISVLIPLNLLAVLGILSFMMPPREPEKVAISITILLSLTFLLSVIENNIPPTSDNIPLLVIYVSAMLVMSFLSVVGNVIVVSIKSWDENDDFKNPQAKHFDNIRGQHHTSAVAYHTKPDVRSTSTLSFLDTDNSEFVTPCISCTRVFVSAELNNKLRPSSNRANKLNKLFMIIGCVTFALISCLMVVMICL